MLRPRIIPCLLVKNKGLVKTVNFKTPKYLGDPINAVRIFNEKQVDELMIVDIDATVEKRGPDFKIIEYWASQCRMPLCYGGGITTIDEAKTIFGLGVEKVALSAAAVNDPTLITKIAEKVGSQSVIVVLDVKKNKNNQYEVFTHNGLKATGIDPIHFAKKMQDFGVGEIVINAIDNDGVMKGYDFNLIDQVRNAVSVPMTVLGGAGTINDIAELIKRFKIIGASAGSLFVFKGIYKAVLINYPSPSDKRKLITEALGIDQ